MKTYMVLVNGRGPIRIHADSVGRDGFRQDLLQFYTTDGEIVAAFDVWDGYMLVACIVGEVG